MIEMNSLTWYAVRTKPRQEDRAAGNLRTLGIETFSPKIGETCYSEKLGERSLIIKALFPGYMFARFGADEMLHKVNLTRGVSYVVSFGGKPTRLDNEVIAMIQSQMGTDKLVRVGGDLLNYGAKVVIRDGPLKDLVAVFQYEMKGTDRVMLLLRTLNYQARVTVERAMVRST